MTSSTLEDLLKHLSPSEFNEARIPIIRDYWVYSPWLAEEIVQQQQKLFEEEKGREVVSPAFPEGARFIPSPGPDLERLGSWNIIEFYGKNYPALQKLELDIARRITVMIGVTATQPWLNWKKTEIRELVDKLVTFNESTKQYLCPESRESLFKFLHGLAHRRATGGSKTDIVTSVFDAYLQWMELQQTDKLGLGATLLEKIACHYSLPIPDPQSRVLQPTSEEESSFFSLPLDPYEALGLIEGVGALYREYFSGVTALNLPVAELSELLFSALKPEADDKYNQGRLLLNHRQEQQLRKLCPIIREQRCQAIEEIEEMVKCASLEVPGYNVVSVMKGGLGNVFLVYHERQGEKRACAVKIFGHRESMAASPVRAQELLSTFSKEELTWREADINALMKKSHQHVVQYIEEITVKYFGEKLPAIKMEYVPGRNLKEYVETEGKLSPTKTALYLEQIVSGLDFLHGNKIICMGDLKPDNILITPDNKVKLIDFGLAWTEQEDPPIPGSRYYTAPEAFADSEAVSPVSDWWGVGMLAYYALTGETLLREKEGQDLPQQLTEMYRQRELPEEYRQKIGETITNAFFRKFILAALQPAVAQREKEVTGYIEAVRTFSQRQAEVTETTKKKITDLRKRSLDHLVREQEGSLVNVPLLSFREGKRGEDEPYSITVEEILKSQEPVLIFGHGGQGKTMLATAIAQKLLSPFQGEEDQKEERTIPLLIEAGELNSVLGRHEPKTADKIIDLIWDSVAEKRIEPHLRSLLGVAYLIDDYHKINPDYRKLLEEMVLTTKSKVLLFSRLERADLQPPKNPGYVTVQIDSRSFSNSLDQFIKARVPEERQAEFKQYLAQYDESINGNFITLHVLTMIFGDAERVLRYYNQGSNLRTAITSGKPLTRTELYEIQTDFVIGNELERKNDDWGLDKVISEIAVHKGQLAELAFKQVMAEKCQSQ